jgi:hypothetical protein
MQSAVISSTTALMVVKVANTSQSNTVILAQNDTVKLTSTEGRLVRIKAASDSGFPILGSVDLDCSDGVVFYPSQSNTSIQVYSSATLMENPANVYNIITYYQGTFTNYVSNPDPGTTIVNVDGSKSILFVDLRTVSKVFVLPSIDSLVANETEAPSFVFKDVYGSIATNTWYISTSGINDTFEGLGTTLRFQSPNMAIEIVGKKGTGGRFTSNYWYILSGYGI